MLLDVEALGKDYGSEVAVRDINLGLRSGEVVGLLGPNGAGKTTTISMIAGVLPPSRGRALIGGHDVQRNPFRAKQLLGLVPQSLALYEDLSARQNLRFFASLYGLRGRERELRIDWALGIAGLRDRDREPVAQFSGGMKRRLNLVVALVHKPQLLVLDEPTVGVDPQSRNFIFAAISELSEESGMAVLYSSHYMEEVQALCSRVAILDHGQVVALDDVDELLQIHAAATVAVSVESTDSTFSVTGAARIEGSTVTLDSINDLDRALAELKEQGVRVTKVSTTEASLETVFLNLTGHSLRDEQ